MDLASDALAHEGEIPLEYSPIEALPDRMARHLTAEVELTACWQRPGRR
jgi:hypothetical protein